MVLLDENYRDVRCGLYLLGPISVEIKRNVAYVCILKTDNVVLYSDI
jgi:hypothetical protein